MEWIDIDKDDKPAMIVRPYVYAHIRETSNAYLIETKKKMSVIYTTDYNNKKIRGLNYEFEKC